MIAVRIYKDAWNAYRSLVEVTIHCKMSYSPSTLKPIVLSATPLGDIPNFPLYQTHFELSAINFNLPLGEQIALYSGKREHEEMGS